MTKTGDMLASLYYRIRKGVLEITVRGAANLKKAIHVSVDRPFAFLSKGEVTKIKELVDKITKQEINRLH